MSIMQLDNHSQLLEMPVSGQYGVNHAAAANKDDASSQAAPSSLTSLFENMCGLVTQIIASSADWAPFEALSPRPPPTVYLAKTPTTVYLANLNAIPLLSPRAPPLEALGTPTVRSLTTQLCTRYIDLGQPLHTHLHTATLYRTEIIDKTHTPVRTHLRG